MEFPHFRDDRLTETIYSLLSSLSFLPFSTCKTGNSFFWQLNSLLSYYFPINLLSFHYLVTTLTTVVTTHLLHVSLLLTTPLLHVSLLLTTPLLHSSLLSYYPLTTTYYPHTIHLCFFSFSFVREMDRTDGTCHLSGHVTSCSPVTQPPPMCRCSKHKSTTQLHPAVCISFLWSLASCSLHTLARFLLMHIC